MYVRSFHHVVEVVDWHFRADDVSSKGRLSLPVSSVYNEGSLGGKFAWCLDFQETRGRRVFGHGVADATLVDRRIFFTLIFGAIYGNVLQSENFESCFVDAWENGSVVNGQCVTRSSAFFREKLWRWPTRDAFVVPRTWNWRSFNLFGSEETSHKDWNPFIDQDGWWKCFIHNEVTNLRELTWAVETNFVNLKNKSCFLVQMLTLPILKRIDAYWWVTGSFYQLNLNYKKYNTFQAVYGQAAVTYRFPLDHRSQAPSSGVSTWMGDHPDTPCCRQHLVH